MKKVYLSGGLRSGWQDKVKDVEGYEFFDPREKDSGSEWNLTKISECDIFLANIEKTNPSGIGAAFELGYAKGVGKQIILVVEDGNGVISERYLDFIKSYADENYSNLEDAILALK